MMRLHELRTLMSEAIFEQIENGPKLQRLAACVKPSCEMTAAQHALVYRDSVLGGMVKSLAEIYPVCERLVGQSFFRVMTRQYCQIQPSTAPDLGDYGETLAEFIAEFPPARNLPYLADTARLEWRWHRVFHAPEPPAFNMSALAEVKPEDYGDLRFRLTPACALFESTFPVNRIWAVNQPDYRGDPIVDLDLGAVRLLIWRPPGYSMHIDPLQPHEWMALNALENNSTFDTVCARVAELDADTNMSDLLTSAIATGWITSFTI